jgi:putative ABC transport system substrate-binding protein
LEKLGWKEGREVQFEWRSYGGDPALARRHAAELVASKPDLLFAAPTSALAAVQRETREIPIVFAQVGDPVGAGFVDSVARPGGNTTGFATTEFAIGPKWVELLREIAPSLSRLGLIYDPLNPTAVGYLPLIDAAARKFKIETSASAVRNEGEIERAIEALASRPNGGLIPLASPLIVVHREFIISLANRHRLPNVFGFRMFPVSGGLASYGVDNIDTYRRAASYIDRILKGEKPSDLPVQFPTKFELVINVRAAQALNLSVPPTLLARADEVIE